jgi:hypothetical protein
VATLTDSSCQAGTKDVFENSTGGTAEVITCTLSSPAAVAGKNLYFSYYLDGGSFNGVTPVADQVALSYMGISSGNCTAETDPNTDTTYTCTNDAADQYAHAPIAGGSDVEPALFVGTNVPAGATAPSGAGLASLVNDSAFNVIFGLAVHCSLLDWTAYPDCATSDYASGGGTGGTLTSLSKTSAASIFAGRYINWDQLPEFGATSGGFTGTRPINVCRRVPGSGTQASAQVHFLGQECNDTSAGNFATTGSWPDFLGGSVEELSSSSRLLDSCVNTKVNSIGISSLEKGPGAVYGNNFQYVAIDGVLPTLENAATGAYTYMFENSLQYHNSANADQIAFLNQLFADAKDASVLAGKPGVLGIPDGVVNTANSPFTSTNPVAWTRRFSEACRAPVAVHP